MNGKRLALGVSAAVVIVAVSGNWGNSSAQVSGEPPAGLTYGGRHARETVWLRLHPSRRVIAALEVPWAAGAERCSNRRGYRSTLYAGVENYATIVVDPQGRFTETVVDRYLDQGNRYKEHQTVTGTVSDERVSGTIRGRAKIVRADGGTVRCTFGPQVWRASN
jgi:hypothetical protein